MDNPGRRLAAMNIDKQYAWRSGSNSLKNSPILPRNMRGLVIEKSGCGKTTLVFNLLLQPNWLDDNHLYVLGKNLHQQEYKVLRKGFEAGLSKQQISNVFANQEDLLAANISPLTAIGTFSDARSGKIKAGFCDDCQDMPDPSTLDPMQKNLMLLDDCFLGKQNKAEAYYTRGRHNNYSRLPRHTVRGNSIFSILFPQDVKNLTHIHADHCASDISLS